MNPQTITCPGCNSRYQTKAAPGKKLACPRCKTVLTVPASAVDLGANDDPLGIGSLERAAVPAARPTSPAPQRTLQSGKFGASGSRGRSARPAIHPELAPFLKRLAIGQAIACTLILLLAIAGWFSEPAALAAAFVGIAIIVALVLAARIWLIVIAFGHSAGLGVATIFVPLMWTYLLATRIGKSQLAVMLMVSALLPCLVSLGAISVLKPKYSPSDRTAARNARMADRADDFVATVLQREAEFPPTGAAQTAVYTCPLRLNDPAKFLAEGERGLSQFAGYVPGSLNFNETERTISFQHRGSQQLESMYRVYLASKTGVIIGSKQAAN